MVKVTADTGRRLALIRLLLGRAEEDSRQAAPFSADSINRLHDVAEMFLVLAAEVNDADVKPKADFMSYWPALSKKLDSPLAYKVQMTKVNQARVGLKHHGIVPTPDVIADCRTAVRGLIQDETPRLFGVELDSVSLAAFIVPPDARTSVIAAETKWKQQKDAMGVSEAFADLAQAFGDLIEDYSSRKLTTSGRSVFKVMDDPPSLWSSQTRLRASHASGDTSANAVLKALEPFAGEVAAALQALEAMTLIIGLGVDVRRYGRFKLLTPDIVRMPGGRRRYVDRDSDPVRTEEDFKFCRDFVISTALHLAEFDFDRDLWRARREGGSTVAIRISEGQ